MCGNESGNIEGEVEYEERKTNLPDMDGDGRNWEVASKIRNQKLIICMMSQK